MLTMRFGESRLLDAECSGDGESADDAVRIVGFENSDAFLKIFGIDRDDDLHVV